MVKGGMAKGRRVEWQRVKLGACLPLRKGVGGMSPGYLAFCLFISSFMGEADGWEEQNGGKAEWRNGGKVNKGARAAVKQRGMIDH
jgi:hypothetical protein